MILFKILWILFYFIAIFHCGILIWANQSDWCLYYLHQEVLRSVVFVGWLVGSLVCSLVRSFAIVRIQPPAETTGGP